MSDSCQHQRTTFSSFLSSAHVVGRCASLRGLCSTPAQLPPQHQVTNNIGLKGSLDSGFNMLQHAPLHGSISIHSLPVELISSIFILGSEFDNPYADSPFLLKPDQEYKPVPSSNFQVLVSHVCQHWRQAALHTQSLWTTLHFRDPSHLSRARVYLARCSKSATLLLDILVDTVAVEDHIPGSTLYNEELYSIFQIIVPHIKRWRAFHLKISDNECKGTARLFLSTCGSAPNLETLQLYHFENYGTSQQLHLATYRPPVIIFSNALPQLKNISLIGVNLGWDNCPFLSSLHNLELALHSQSVRPDYRCWARILRSSSELKILSLHYSGPKPATGDPSQAWPSEDYKIQLQELRELNLTDLDPEYLCDLIDRLYLPNLRRLTLDLPDQDYTSFITLVVGPLQQPSDISTEMGATVSSDASHTPNVIQQVSPSIPRNLPTASFTNLETLIIRALNCTLASWIAFLWALKRLRTLEVDFSRVGSAFWTVFTQEGEALIDTSDPTTTTKIQKMLVLPLLEKFKLTGVSGREIISALVYRHNHCSKPNFPPQEWIIGWDDQRRKKDVELSALIDKGFWIAEDGSKGRKVIIRNYYDEEEEGEDPDEEDGEEEEEEFEESEE